MGVLTSGEGAERRQLSDGSDEVQDAEFADDVAKDAEDQTKKE